MSRYLPICLILGLVVAFRVVGSFLPETQPNFQPLAALFFCGALLAGGFRGFAIPFALWAVTYPFGIGPVTDFPIFITTLAGLAIVFLIGKSFTSRGIPMALVGSFIAAIAFHLVTNTAAWIGDPMYAKSLTGLWQSLWAGPVGSPIPSWVFLKNLAAANLLFTAIFFAAQLRLPALPSADPHPHSAK
jgi:hypothetical protein